MKPKGIFIEGKILEEFLRDKEQLTDEIERQQLMKENLPDTSLYNKPRINYKPHAEKNGKVRTLDISEINQSIYKDEITKRVKAHDFHGIFLVQMICGPNVYMGNADIKKAVNDLGIDYPIKNFVIKLRNAVKNVLKTPIKDHLDIVHKRAMEYKVKKVSYETYSLKDFIMIYYQKSIQIQEIPLIKEEIPLIKDVKSCLPTRDININGPITVNINFFQK